MSKFDLDSALLDSLQKYFITLKNAGYYKYDNVNKLLALLFINDVLDSDLNEFITIEDYQDICKAITCLFGSDCVLSLPSFQDIYGVTKYTPIEDVVIN